MAPHSSTLAWKLPWTEEPGRLRSMGSLRVRHNLATSLSLFTFMHWRRKWQPTPVFLPGGSQGRGTGGLPFMRSHRVGQDWSDLAVAAVKSIRLSQTFIHTTMFNAFPSPPTKSNFSKRLVTQCCYPCIFRKKHVFYVAQFGELQKSEVQVSQKTKVFLLFS